MSLTEISLYNALRKKLGDPESEELVAFIKGELQADSTAKADIFFTKADKIDLLDRINKSKSEIIIWVVSSMIVQSILLLVTRHFL